jgi:hypothetical protein
MNSSYNLTILFNNQLAAKVETMDVHSTPRLHEILQLKGEMRGKSILTTPNPFKYWGLEVPKFY